MLNPVHARLVVARGPLGSGLCSGWPTAMSAKGVTPRGLPRATSTAAMRSFSGAMPSHTALRPRLAASMRMFSTEALMS